MADNKSVAEETLGSVGARFDAYDLYGYLVPGAVLAYGLYLHMRLLVPGGVPPDVSRYVPEILTKGDWPSFLGLACLSLVAVYIIGHFVASASSSLLDKLLLERTLGFPYQRLFCTVLKYDQVPALYYTRKSQLFYKSLLVIAIAWFCLYVWDLWQPARSILAALFVTTFIAKVVFSYLSLVDWHDPSVLRASHTRRLKWANRVWGVARYALLPWYGFFNIIGYGSLSFIFRMCKPFEQKMQTDFRDKFMSTFGLSLKDVGTNAYWLTYCFMCQRDKVSTRMIQHWLNLYAFSRNLAAAFLILFFYSAIYDRFESASDRGVFRSWLGATAVGALLFWLRYYYIYYNYYSKYIFRAFVTWPAARGRSPRVGQMPEPGKKKPPSKTEGESKVYQE